MSTTHLPEALASGEPRDGLTLPDVLAFLRERWASAQGDADKAGEPDAEEVYQATADAYLDVIEHVVLDPDAHGTDATPWGAEDLAGCVADGEHHPWTRHPKAECPTMGEPDVVLGCDDCGSVDVEQGTALCKACRKARAGHPLTLVQDSKYAHLFRGECACGWSTTGYVKAAMADSWHDRHVADRLVLAGV